MKITILGAGGKIGQRIVKEAIARKHELSLITSKNHAFFGLENNKDVIIQAGDIFKTEALANLFKGSDVVISAYAPPSNNNALLIEATQSLVEAAKQVHIRLIAVGGAGSLKVNDHTQLVDTPEFPEAYKEIAEVHRTALETIYYKETELNWTNVSPSAYIFEGERSNQFRIAEDNLLVNDKGESAISMEDFAIGILNEVENAQFIKKRFTIGY